MASENKARDSQQHINPVTVLLDSMRAALETYSNVHRGSGHKSQVTTHLFEKARDIVLDYLGLKKASYLVIFCTPARAVALTKGISAEHFKILSSREFGLPLGVRAVAVRKKSLPDGVPFQVGGGTTKLYSKNWVIWAGVPDKFEAGTPAIINIIAFARALLLIGEYGKDVFRQHVSDKSSSEEMLDKVENKGFSGKRLLAQVHKTAIGHRLPVPTAGGMKPFINLDNSASTPAFEEVWEAFKAAFLTDQGRHRQIIEAARNICSVALGAPMTDYDIIFTSNGTEAINLLAACLKQEMNGNPDQFIMNTILEHSSNDLPWRTVNGNEVIRLEVNKMGFWDIDELGRVLEAHNGERAQSAKRIRLVAASGASNVLGVCNDLEALSRVVHSHDAELMIDGAQLVAHREVNMIKSGIDYLAFSAHKVYAPFGCGVLIARKGSLTEESIRAAGESGEENVGGIAALGKSLQLLQEIGFETIREHEQTLTRLAIDGMKQIPGLTVQGIVATDSPAFGHKIGVIVFDIKNNMAGSIAGKLARNQAIGVRYGCHCAHLVVKYLANFTPRTEKIQKFVVKLVPALKLQGLVRVSFGLENTKEDVEILLNELRNIAEKQNQPGRKSEIKTRIREFIHQREKLVYGD